jgi:molybdopterin synthase catalytic subunit/molybdopterin converting factor small subunit
VSAERASVHIRLELMGRAAVDAGARSLELDLPAGATAADAVERLVAKHPSLSWLRRVARPAVNFEYVGWEHPLADGDEVAFIPPVSGGSPSAEGCVFCEITEAPLDTERLVRRVERPEAGALVTFAGVVRNHSRGRTVLYLEYDAYRPMAERKMREIGEEAARRWECRIALQHRVGRLEIGEASVLIAVSAAHRGTAFEACRFAIDTLKETVPIWKKEVWEGGEVWIEGEREAPTPER